MRIALLILAVLAFFLGAIILPFAKSAIHEIEAFILFLIGAVFISASSILDSLNLIKKGVDKR